MSRSGSRTLDGLIASGLVISGVFATRSQAHFWARAGAALFAIAAATRLLARRAAAPIKGHVAAVGNSTLVSIVAHEIRAPLAAIRGAVALLDEHDATLDPARRGELFSVALDATKQLGHLVDDLLLVSRIAGGRLRVEQAVLDLPAVVQEAANAEIQHTITIVDQTGMPHVYGDAMRARQVVTNLLSNAGANASESSIIVVAITKGDDDVRVTIYNEGRGISPEAQSRLFLPFASVNERRVDSTGLGLYIAKELVEAMGGTIGFDTQPGRNAAFWFTLKVAPPQP